jgi:hypothetical protein
MSILIDELLKNCKATSTLIDGKQYVAKSINYWSLNNIIDAWRVLIGNSRAYHFKEDEFKMNNGGEI